MAENINQELQEVQEQEVVETKVFYAISKKEDKLLVESLDDYKDYSVDGIAVKGGNEENIVICGLSEGQYVIGDTEDLPEGDKRRDIPSPSMTDFDGKLRTEFLKEMHGNNPAIEYAEGYGWIPAGGELDLVIKNKEAVEKKINAAGGNVLAGENYWTSNQFNNEHIWSLNIAEGKYEMWHGKKNQFSVRPVKATKGYREV